MVGVLRMACVQVGLASVLGTAVAPLAGAVAFRRLGLLDRLPASVQPRIKQLHRRVSLHIWMTYSLTWAPDMWGWQSA